MTKEDFVKTMMLYHKAITPKMDDGQIDMLIQIWVHDLEKYSLDQLKEAWNKYRKKNEFLSLAKLTDILDAEEEVEYDYEAMYQWQQFWIELRHRSSDMIRFDDPLTAYIAKSVMPIQQLKMTGKDEDLGIYQNRFVKEYKSLREKKGIYQHILATGGEMLTGTGRGVLESKANEQKLIEGGKNAG